MQTCALCMCITMCIFCAGFMLMWLWGKPEEEEEDEWAEWEEEQAALQAALEAANQSAAGNSTRRLLAQWVNNTLVEKAVPLIMSWAPKLNDVGSSYNFSLAPQGPFMMSSCTITHIS